MAAAGNKGAKGAQGAKKGAARGRGKGQGGASAAALRARRESQAAQINAACTRLAQLRDQIDRTAALADIRVDQALSQANQSLARYGKACYFQALERELPRVVRSFCAGQSVNQDLRAEMDRLLKEDRR